MLMAMNSASAIIEACLYPTCNGFGTWAAILSQTAGNFILDELLVPGHSRLAWTIFVRAIYPFEKKVIEDIVHNSVKTSSSSSTKIPAEMGHRVPIFQVFTDAFRGQLLHFKDEEVRKHDVMETIGEVAIHHQKQNEILDAKIAEMNQKLLELEKGSKTGTTSPNSSSALGKRKDRNAANQNKANKFRNDFQTKTGKNYTRNFKHGKCKTCVMCHLLNIPCFVDSHWSKFPETTKAKVLKEFSDVDDLISKFMSNPNKYQK